MTEFKPQSLAKKRPDLTRLLFNQDDAVLTCGSNKRVMWSCDNGFGHLYDMQVSNKALRNQGCPICAGRRILPGFNDLETKRPDLAQLLNMEETHRKSVISPEKNWVTSPSQVSEKSQRHAVWNCENGERHRFDMSVANRVLGKGCPYCSGRRILPGFNDLSTVRPDIAQYFNVEETLRQAKLNPEKKWATTPEEVTAGSDRLAVWDCENSERHGFEMSVYGRCRGYGCPICLGKSVLSGFNDLLSQRPDIAQYFNVEETLRQAKLNPEKKWALSPEEVTSGSSFWAVWDCENGLKHWYYMQVYVRVKGHGCAVCGGRQVFSGFNDLASLRPDVAALWDYQGNSRKADEKTEHPQVPEEVTISSNRLCLWMCAKCSRSFVRAVNGMTSKGASRLCPSCTESQGEKELAEFIADLLPGDMKTLRNDRTVLRPRELDVYIPALGLAFEFNGDYYHSDEVLKEKYGETAEEYHTKKLDNCTHQGIDLFFVWESDWNDSRKRQTIERYIKEIISLRLENKRLEKNYALLTILSKG